jgi:nicotinate-nucleotide adenylyltransferase
LVRIGVLGGSFDPIHIGHLVIAEEARLRLSLDTVLFVPTGFQWMKEGRQTAPGAERIEMVRLATASNAAFEVSDVEVSRPGPSYTVDTLSILRRQRGPEAELFFILGQDALADLPRWSRPEQLLQLCTLVAMPRVDSPPVDLAGLERQLPGLRDRLVLLEDAPRLEVSSSALRARIARNESVRYLVPDAVAEYIARRGLYGATAPRGS